MMSPNGSIPPIHVPPGYISQVSAIFQNNIINKYYKFSLNMAWKREKNMYLFFSTTIILTLPSVFKKKETRKP